MAINVLRVQHSGGILSALLSSLGNPIKSDQIRSNPVKSDQIRPNPIKPDGEFCFSLQSVVFPPNKHFDILSSWLSRYSEGLDFYTNKQWRLHNRHFRKPH